MSSTNLVIQSCRNNKKEKKSFEEQKPLKVATMPKLFVRMNAITTLSSAVAVAIIKGDKKESCSTAVVHSSISFDCHS